MRTLCLLALAAGLLATGAAACRDRAYIELPSAPTPPFSAAMAPDSATVVVGSSVVFGVNAAGGEAGLAASWTCASSDTGVATVSAVSAGCQARGISAGSVRVTATVTKGGETANVGAGLRVTGQETGEPAFPTTSLPAEFDTTVARERVDVALHVEHRDRSPGLLPPPADGGVSRHRGPGAARERRSLPIPPERTASPGGLLPRTLLPVRLAASSARPRAVRRRPGTPVNQAVRRR